MGRGKSNKVNDKLMADIALPHDEQITYIQNVLGVDINRASDILEAFEMWSNYGSSAIHNEQNYLDNPNLHGVIKTGKEYAQLIDEYLNSPNVPKIKQTLYRDMRVSTNNLASIDSMLESGVWKDRGYYSVFIWKR